MASPWSRQKINCGTVTEPSGSPLSKLAPSCTIFSGFGKGSGRSSTAFTTLKMAVFAPMPRARVRPTTAVKPGLLPSMRAPYRKSWIRVSTKLTPRASRHSSLARSIPPNSSRAWRMASSRGTPLSIKSSAYASKWKRSSRSISFSRRERCRMACSQDRRRLQ